MSERRYCNNCQALKPAAGFKSFRIKNHTTRYMCADCAERRLKPRSVESRDAFGKTITAANKKAQSDRLRSCIFMKESLK